jgi:uncharacterized protein (TIGR02270 family)
LGLNGEDHLWDVLEEHLDEAEFCLSQVERILDHPQLTLADLERAWEPRWIADVDALLVGGALVRDRLLIPLLEAAEATERVTVCGVALLASGQHDRFLASCLSSNAIVRRALARACGLRPDPSLVGLAVQRLGAATTPEERAGMLEVLAALQSGTPDIARHLRSEAPLVVTAAVGAARFCDADAEALRELERIIAEGEPELIEPAAIAALALGSTTAFSLLEQRVLAREARAPRTALALLAALGGPPQHACIQEMLSDAALEKEALFALGYSGNLACVPVLLERAKAGTPGGSKLALQSLSMILGIDPSDDTLRAPSPQNERGAGAGKEDGALEEDLELPPLPEDELPMVDPDKLAQRVENARVAFAPDLRYLAGRRYDNAGILDLLERRPMGWRHIWATIVLINSRGRVRLDTRARATRQVEQLALVRERISSMGKA